MCLVLVVDDEELARVSMAAILAMLGHEIIQARDGLEALLIYRMKQLKIHLVLMDIAMPRMDGIAAAKVMRAVNPAARIILVSGDAAQVPPEVEPSGFLLKPFRSKALCAIVQQALEGVG
jgi:CheY-like chemotaxis protein